MVVIINTGAHDKNDKVWKVYCHTNKINGKKYIGITSKSTQQRWKQGSGYSNNTYFYKAIKKYGWDSFDHEVLFSGLTVDEAAAKEMELIERYNTFDKNYGYNCTRGGDGVKGYVMSEERRAELSKSMMGNKYALGYRHTDETKKRISEASKGNHYALGNKLSPEARKRISEAMKNRVVSEETRKKLSEISKGRKHSEETRRKISESKTGKTHKGVPHSDEAKKKMSEAHKKLFAEHPEMAIRISERLKIPVDMYSRSGEFIRSFPSSVDAKRELGIDNSSIIKVCKGVAGSAGGYYWRYHDKAS